VEETGSTITIGCHLDFKLHLHGRPVDPERSLEHRIIIAK
jgi:hypothetical protein